MGDLNEGATNGGWLERVGEGLVAGAVASVPSGIPSTVHALCTGRDARDTVRAAGSLLAPADASELVLLASGAVAHVAISLGWGAVLGVVLPRNAPVAWGAVAGLAIAELDLGIVGRRIPQIRPLPALPQVADHLAYGVLVGAVLACRVRGSGRGLGTRLRAEGLSGAR